MSRINFVKQEAEKHHGTRSPGDSETETCDRFYTQSPFSKFMGKKNICKYIIHKCNHLLHKINIFLITNIFIDFLNTKFIMQIYQL